jgi:hypothetical protein
MSPRLLLHFLPLLSIFWLSVVLFSQVYTLAIHISSTQVSDLVQLASHIDASSKSVAKDVVPLAFYIDASSKPITSLPNQATTVQTRRRAIVMG